MLVRSVLAVTLLTAPSYIGGVQRRPTAHGLLRALTQHIIERRVPGAGRESGYGAFLQ
jgi:hypothetical protein